MATSGSTSVTVTNWDTLKFTWSQKSQSVSANTTTVEWKMELIAGSSGRISSSASKSWSVTVNGAKYSGSNTVGISNNSTKTLASGTTTITHNSDGTKSFSYSFSQQFSITFSGSSIGTKSGSGSGTLNTIPRATTPTVSSSSVDMGSKVTINTPRASSGFTHDLAYSFVGGGYVNIKTGVGTSYEWTVPDLATSVPNATSGTMTIRCVTKNGSTTIGTKTVTMTVKVPASVKPTISTVTLTEAVSGLAAQFGGYVQGKSKVTATITAAGAKGSTIKSYSTSFQGATYTGRTWTSGFLASSGSISMTTTVTDSRNRTASKTTTITGVQAYTAPEITALRTYRINAAGAPDTEGTRMAVELSYSVAPVNNKNTARLDLEYKQTTATEWVPLDYFTALQASGVPAYDGPFSVDYQYDVRATLTDWFGAKTVYTAAPLPSGAVILDISSDGLGIAFGTTSDRSGVLFGWPAKGQVFGLGEATADLPSGADLNDYHVPGIYSTVSDANVKTLSNCPSQYAGTIRVYNSLGQAKVTGPYVYIIQEYRSWRVSEPTYRRSLETGADGSWSAGAWVEG